MVATTESGIGPIPGLSRASQLPNMSLDPPEAFFGWLQLLEHVAGAEESVQNTPK